MNRSNFKMIKKNLKYLLFISYNSGLKHNCLYNSSLEVAESIEQLIEEELPSTENIFSISEIEKCLSDNDDLFYQLSNGTWLHIQHYPIFSKI